MQKTANKHPKQQQGEINIVTKHCHQRVNGLFYIVLYVQQAGFTADGKLVAVEMELFSNAGCSADKSFKVYVFHISLPLPPPPIPPSPAL